AIGVNPTADPEYRLCRRSGPPHVGTRQVVSASGLVAGFAASFRPGRMQVRQRVAKQAAWVPGHWQPAVTLVKCIQRITANGPVAAGCRQPPFSSRAAARPDPLGLAEWLFVDRRGEAYCFPAAHATVSVNGVTLLHRQAPKIRRSPLFRRGSAL